MDPYLSNLLIVIFILVTLILIMVGAIVLIRLRSARNRRIYRQKAREWEDIFLDYLHGGLGLEEACRRMAGEKRYYWLWIFFAPYLEVLTGVDFEKTKALCRELGMIGYYRRKLHRGRTPARALAARVLGSLQCRDSVPGMLEMLRSKNPLIVQAAAQGLAKSGDTKSFFPAARALLSHTYFTYEGITEILSSYGKEACPLFKEGIVAGAKRLPDPRRAPGGRVPKKKPRRGEVDPSVVTSIMIDLLGYFRCPGSLSPLGRLLERADDEITVHILKAFLRFGEVPPGFDIKPYLRHRYWVARSFSAKAWKLTGDRQALPLLEELLTDRNWWVRFHAAEALRSAGGPGLTILEDQAAGTDQTAAAISSYVLSRSEVSQPS